jgi:valyl-tRNA synthetase
MLDKTYRPDAVESAIYRRWEESGAFQRGRRPDARPYTIVIPPPNVTGSLHIGHALNNTLQDILIRFERMRGRDVLWQPGMDHAGIATQMVVERQLEAENSSRRELGRDAFVKRVWDWKEHSGGLILNQLRRLGASCDWSRERFTMDEGLSRAVTKVFIDFFRQGLIYKDKRLVNWDPKLHTAISDLEVEQRETKGKLWYFKYPIEGTETEFVTVATTRPETMLGDTAVAVHPEDERYAHLKDRHCILPIVGRRLAVVYDELADPEKGSGAVKITPAHDFGDFEVGRRHDLPMINIFDRDATLNENAPEAYRGLDRFAARERIVDEMSALGLLEGVEENLMTLPYGDRSGVVVEPWLTDQWFADAAALAGPAIEAIESGATVFVPRHWENTFFEWMRNIQPWCISRQLWWGHRIPAWYGPDGKIFVEASTDEVQAAAGRHYGREVELVQDADVLDTWFSSALWPFSTFGWPDETEVLRRHYPNDTLVTSFDIIFFWVARMMMVGLHFLGEVPFRQVYIHALVRDAHGQKMSKSKGNVLDPIELLDRYGTDAVRFTLTALAVQGRDLKVDESRIAGYRNFVTKLWNAARYCELNGCAPVADFDPAANRLDVNRWIVSRIAEAAAETTTALETFRFNEAAGALYQFTWGTFCDWYLEFTKPILAGDDAEAIAETRATTAWVVEQLLRLLHPIMPFVTEELWERTGGQRTNMLIEESWPVFADALGDVEAEAEMGWLVRIISQIRSIRSEMNVSPSEKLSVLLKDASDVTRDRLHRHRGLIERLARLASAEIASDGEVPEGSVHDVLDEATLIIPLAGIIDVELEKSRLAREIAKIETEILRLDKKLGNEGFLAKAPPTVIEAQQDRRAEADQARVKLVEARDRLAVM